MYLIRLDFLTPSSLQIFSNSNAYLAVGRNPIILLFVFFIAFCFTFINI